jgi:hypothetical protein
MRTRVSGAVGAGRTIFPAERLGRILSSLLCIVAAEIGVDVGAVGQTTLTLGILKVSEYLKRITQATLAHEITPYFDVLVRQRPSDVQAPREKFPIGATL